MMATRGSGTKCCLCFTAGDDDEVGFAVGAVVTVVAEAVVGGGTSLFSLEDAIVCMNNTRWNKASNKF
jgi:hypothetical protein